MRHFFKAPVGVTSVSIAGVEHVAVDGVIEGDSELAPLLAPLGFSILTDEQQSEPTGGTDGDPPQGGDPLAKADTGDNTDATDPTGQAGDAPADPVQPPAPPADAATTSTDAPANGVDGQAAADVAGAAPATGDATGAADVAAAAAPKPKKPRTSKPAE